MPKQKSTSKAATTKKVAKKSTKKPATKTVKKVSTRVKQQPKASLFKRKWATFSSLPAPGKVVGVCFAIAACLSVPLVLMALGYALVFSFRGPSLFTYAFFLGTAAFFSVSLAVIYALGRVSVRSSGVKAQVAGGVAITLSLLHSYILMRLFIGV